MTTHLVRDDVLEREAAPEAVFGSVCTVISFHAAARPDHPAVVDETGRVTYAELQRRSGLLAARLAEHGVGPGSCVGIFLDRSTDFVVAAYAVLRAGAAYLPLDIATPGERLAFVLADAGTAVVVTRDAGALPTGPWTTVDVTEQGAGAPGGVAPGPDDLAYVIYTSGSTGSPKGVELTHTNLINLVDWHVEAFAVTADDHTSQVASVGFDAAVWEIWPALAAGATLHVAGEATRRAAPALRDWLVAEEIAVAFAPTVLAEQLIDVAWPPGTRLRTLLTGADALHRRPPVGLPFTLVNNYGPTECTVVATSGPVDPHGAAGPPTIGRPIADTAALVLDDELAPVAPGQQGELCLAGALVGRGYRNDPELTARRFVTLHGDGGSPLRVYRTGDRVRLLPDGQIDFLGRLDRQVKLRGYRIEPAEIVAALDRVPAVRAAAVVARHNAETDAEPELVAYVVRAEGAAPTAQELRHHLAARLPDYMIPAKFVGIVELPVTLHGKLDEAALPSPSPENLLPGQVGAPSATDDAAGSTTGSIQEQVAALVCELLKVSAVGADDNIFVVGGHSMLAMQLVARIKHVFGVKLALREVFEKPTVIGLANAVLERTTASPSPTADR
ncbi:MAG TPA: non-ribosomal peptide synthetase [Pseudonocardia sp.]